MFYNYQLTFELNRMVDIYGKDYKFTILRKTLENLKDEKKRELVYIKINTLNNICEVVYSMCSDFDENQKKEMIDNFFELYIRYLQRYRYFIMDVISSFKDEIRKNFEKEIFIHWNNIEGKEKDITYKRNFLDLFDDLHENCIVKYESVFIKKLGELNNLYRAQRGKHFDNYERMIPKAEYVRNKNRWNPEGSAFIYLGFEDEIEQFDGDINYIEKTCFEELRLRKGEYVSVCKFRPLNSNAKIINLCYEDISYDDIEHRSEKTLNELIELHADDIINNIRYKKLIGTSLSTEDTIKKIIMKEFDKKEIRPIIKKETEVSIGNLIMKGIDEAVFLPVDSKEDPELKAYIPFHYLAEYLINKGYSGILYRSTRMNKIGLKGKNLVLFNTEDITYIKNSMNVYYYDGRKYKRTINS